MFKIRIKTIPVKTLLPVFFLGVFCLPSLLFGADLPPTLDFSATQTTGCPSLSVTFIDESFEDVSDPIVEWEWDFGDGQGSFDFSPTHVYAFEGDFTVKHMVMTQSGLRDTITKTAYIKVSNSFNVNLGPDTLICSGSSIILDATVPGASSYLWNDGTTTATLETFMEGEYSLEVTNAGCTDRDTIYVSLGPVLSADFNYDYVVGCTPSPVTFTDLSQSCTGPVNDWAWDFGDGGTSTVQNPVHVFLTPGDYLITLTVKNTVGSVYSMNKTITIDGTAGPIVDLGSDQTICDWTTTTLSATNSGATYLWSTGATDPSITVGTTGKYYVDVSRDGCTSTDTVQITVLPEIQANFTSQKLIGCLPVKMKYTDQSIFCSGTITDWLWDFGDGTTSTDQNPEHDFATAGSFPVKLTVNGSSGGSSTKTTTTVVTPVTLNVALGNDTTICDSEVLQLDAGNAGATYEWSTGETTQKINVFMDAQYSVKVSQDGCVANDTINLSTIPALNVKAGYNVQSTCLPVPVSFTDSTLISCGQTITDWYWEFGDGMVSNQQNPVHQYSSANNFTVRLTVTASGGSTATKTMAVRVNNTPYTLDLPDETQVCRGTPARLDAGVTGAQYSWTPVNGLSDPSIRNPDLNPSMNGWYHVQVTKCMVTTTDSTFIRIDSVSKPAIVQEGNLLKTTDAASYQWYRDGQLISNATSKTIRLDRQGYYTVKAFSNSGCEKESLPFFFLPFSGKEKDSGIRVKCTPNPNSGVFNIVFSEVPSKPARVTIYDAKGAKIQVMQLKDHVNLLNGYKLKKGIYMVEVVVENKRIVIPVLVQ